MPSETQSSLTVKAIRGRAVLVPMRRPLVTAGGSVSVAPLVLIDLETAEGPIGHAYIFTYTQAALRSAAALVNDIGAMLVGRSAMPVDLAQTLSGMFRLLGYEGLTGMATAGLDVAAWDALAKAQGVPLVQALGGTARPIQAYNSCGLGMIGPDAVAKAAEDLLSDGFDAVKLRLGYRTWREDAQAIAEVRRAAGSGAAIMTDYNQCLSVAESEIRIRALSEQDVAWIEEPTRYNDYAGYARIRQSAALPIQLGENCWGPGDIARAIDLGAGDYLMPDLIKVGGVSGWVKATAMCEAAGIPVSCHLFPEVSAHLLAATPGAHWLEYVDWAEPILATPLRRTHGFGHPGDAPGAGLAWDEAAVARYAV